MLPGSGRPRQARGHDHPALARTASLNPRLPASSGDAHDLTRSITAALDAKTKPLGSLGRLESLAVEIGIAQGRARPSVDPASVIVFAADHGVAADGVSAYPPEVTAQMCATFTDGGAAVSVLAASVGARLEVVDVGVNADVTHIGGLVHAKVAPGTANMRHGPAMSTRDAQAACEVGRTVFERAVLAGSRCVVLGEMGIGNTTSAAVLTALVCGRSAAEVTGPGTGLDARALEAKRGVVAQVLERVRSTDDAAHLWLQQAGGLEIAALVGAMMQAPRSRVPVVVDGFIATAAALVACRMDGDVRRQLVFAHRSAEPGHAVALEELGATPLLDLGLALGEGSGATLALPLLRAACEIVEKMATFTDAGVSEGAS